MSTELIEAISESNETVHVTSHWGGKAKGVCLQLSQDTSHESNPASWRNPMTQDRFHSVQLTAEQARAVHDELGRWLDEHRRMLENNTSL